MTASAQYTVTDVAVLLQLFVEHARLIEAFTIMFAVCLISSGHV